MSASAHALIRSFLDSVERIKDGFLPDHERRRVFFRIVEDTRTYRTLAATQRF